MAPPDVRDVSAMCAGFMQARLALAHLLRSCSADACACPRPLASLASQAYDAGDASLLAPFLSEDVQYVGLVADHTGASRVAHALFGGGERRACKPQRAFAAAPDGAPGVETTYDMAIQSLALWPEQMYLDRVTVRDGKARASPQPARVPCCACNAAQTSHHATHRASARAYTLQMRRERC
jgi:hypothetical protein